MRTKKKSLVLQTDTGRGRRAAWLLAALLLTTATWILTTPHFAAAQDEATGPPADSDGYVPIYSVCFPENEFAGEGGNIYDLAALYVPYDNGSSIEGYVLLNECALERYGAGPNDIQHVIDHELGHAAGLPDSDDPSSIMYPYYLTTGT